MGRGCPFFGRFGRWVRDCDDCGSGVVRRGGGDTPSLRDSGSEEVLAVPGLKPGALGRWPFRALGAALAGCRFGGRWHRLRGWWWWSGRSVSPPPGLVSWWGAGTRGLRHGLGSGARFRASAFSVDRNARVFRRVNVAEAVCHMSRSLELVVRGGWWTRGARPALWAGVPGGTLTVTGGRQ